MMKKKECLIKRGTNKYKEKASSYKINSNDIEYNKRARGNKLRTKKYL